MKGISKIDQLPIIQIRNEMFLVSYSNIRYVLCSLVSHGDITFVASAVLQ